MSDTRGGDDLPRLTVIVPNYNGAVHLEPCFASLQALDYPADRLDLVLVDNASVDDSVALVERQFPGVRVLRNRSNLGFATACNLGVTSTEAPFVALLNNDARVDPRWARELLAPMLARPTVAAVGARLLDWTGEHIDFAGGLLNFYGHAFQRLYGAPASADSERRERPTLFACGGAMAVRRDVFLASGGFDDAYFAFFEDVDLGWRLWVLGHEVLYTPEAVAYHRGHATASRVPSHQLRVLYERNALYTILKNYETDTLARVLPAALLLAAQRGLMTGRVETAPYVLGQNGGDAEASIARLAMSYFLALGEVGLKLDEVWERRAAVQRARRRPDAAILPLFGEPFMPNHVDPSYLETQSRVVRVFGIAEIFASAARPTGSLAPTSERALTGPSNVLDEREVPGAGDTQPHTRSSIASPNRTAPVVLICGDPVGATMAGPGVRSWEMARALARAGEPVVLCVPNADAPPGERFAVHSYQEDPSRVLPVTRGAKAILVQGFLLHKVPALREVGPPLIVDLYDPFILENLAFFSTDRLTFRRAIHGEHLQVLNDQLRAGDYFLCASERQRDYWLGMLAANNRLNPETYDADPTLRALIDVVPFGVPPEPPTATRPVLKGVLPGVAATDKVVLWGGGLWDWFDPLTLLRAVAHIARDRVDVRVVFLGTRHPNPTLPQMAMPRRAQELARELGLADRVALFLDWVPYADRAAYLLEADVGVSLNPDGVETRYAFRSRLLDCFWAGLPLVCTRGDTLADLVEREGLGRVVAPGDTAGVVEALLALLATPGERARLAPRFAQVAATLTWDRAVQPLARFCAQPHVAPDRSRAEADTPVPPRRANGRRSTRGRAPAGAISVVSYAVRPTPWWRLPGRAWHVFRLGGAPRLRQEIGSYLRWRRARGLAPRP